MPLDSEIPFDQSDFEEMVEKRVTCPFVGNAVLGRRLPVLNTVANPLARIDDVRRLGNTGGGDLGDVLALFASGNHAFMHGPVDQLNQPVPGGLFCLDFPGSQGSHPGHSGILQTNPHQPGSGQFSQPNFDRLRTRADKGFLTRSDIADFIADNLHRDPESKVFAPAVFQDLARDFGHFLESAGSTLLAELRAPRRLSEKPRILEEKLTKFTGEDNLVGSCGEFGLLFALLANRPGGMVNGETVLLWGDLESIFVKKQLPVGWDTWKKTRIDWLINSTELMITAGKAYRALGGSATPAV
jgi:hypothetical protein